MAIKVSGTSVINDSRRLENIASVDSTTAASMTAAGVGGTPSGTNAFDAPVKGDGSGGLRFAGYDLGTGSQFTSGSGNYTVPSGVPYIKVYVTGGGGGGGGGSGYSAGFFHSGGAGGGATIVGMLAVSAGQTIAYSVGAKGVGGTGQVVGTNGGNSTLARSGTTFATGGGGSGTAGSTGGAAGTTSSSLLQAMVPSGTTAGTNGGGNFVGGNGGSSFYGGGTNGGSFYGGNGGNASDATFPGAGGGGGASASAASKSGGDGGPGFIKIENWSGLE